MLHANKFLNTQSAISSRVIERHARKNSALMLSAGPQTPEI